MAKWPSSEHGRKLIMIYTYVGKCWLWWEFLIRSEQIKNESQKVVFVQFQQSSIIKVQNKLSQPFSAERPSPHQAIWVRLTMSFRQSHSHTTLRYIEKGRFHKTISGRPDGLGCTHNTGQATMKHRVLLSIHKSARQLLKVSQNQFTLRPGHSSQCLKKCNKT